MESKTEIQKGVGYAVLSNVFWAFFPVLTVITYRTFPSMLALGLTTGSAAVFFCIVLIVRGKLKEIFTPNLLRYVFFITLFIAVGGYGFYFLGLMYTTPGNASLIGLFEVFTSFLFFNVFRKEAFSRMHIIGTLCMLSGALIILAPKAGVGVSAGSFLILLSTIIAPFGNRYQQKARAIASTETIMFLRNTFATPIFIVIAALSGQLRLVGEVTPTVLIALLSNAVLIFGVSKILFIEAIHRITVTRVIALSSVASFLTLLIAWAVLGMKPEPIQLLALIPLTLGVLLLTDQFPLRKS